MCVPCGLVNFERSVNRPLPVMYTVRIQFLNLNSFNAIAYGNERSGVKRIFHPRQNGICQFRVCPHINLVNVCVKVELS
jgi:hypothetical protein